MSKVRDSFEPKGRSAHEEMLTNRPEMMSGFRIACFEEQFQFEAPPDIMNGMNWTLRSQNLCEACNYTWFPRGKNLSNKCPNCRSGRVVIAPVGSFGFGIFVVLAVLGVGALLLDQWPSDSTQRRPAVVAEDKEAPKTLQSGSPTPLASPPRLSPYLREPWPSAVLVAEAQREAVRRFPELGVSGSSLNREFVERFSSRKRTEPDFFRNSAWPVRLAEEADAALKK